MRTLMLTLPLLLAACGQSEQTITHTDSEGKDRTVTVRDSGDTRTVTSGDGLIAATGTRGGENARFPAYAPQYPGARVQTVVNMDVGTASTGGVKQHTITMITSDTPDAVIAFYRDKITASGKPFKEVNGATGPMLTIGAGSLLDAEGYVTAMPAGASGTSVNVVVQERQPRS